MGLSDYRNRHRAERCFVLGTGPSLRGVDLSSLASERTIGCNWLVNHSEIAALNLDYYGAYDDGFVAPEINEAWRSKLAALPCSFFFPESWSGQKLALERVEYFRYRPELKIYHQAPFSPDLSAGVADGGTVIINVCLPLALHLGCKEVVLLGVDTDYGIGQHGDQRHAYFYPQDQQQTENRHTVASERRWIENCLTAYQAVADYAQGAGVSIVNASGGGGLDVFPRVTLASVL